MELEEILSKLWEVGTEYIAITNENDSFPKYHGEIALYHTERQILIIVGDHPGITITEIAPMIHKTTSICSQIIRKFVNYGWVEQNRNEKNRRIYNLQLTAEGKLAYDTYASYMNWEKEMIINVLKECSPEELEAYMNVQIAMNEACRKINARYCDK